MQTDCGGIKSFCRCHHPVKNLTCDTISLADFFVCRGRYAIMDIFRPDGVYRAWSYRGLIAYGAGFAAEIPFMVRPPRYTGPLARGLGNVDVSWVIGGAVTAVVYLLLTRTVDDAAEQAAIETSDSEMQAVSSQAGT